MDQEIVINKVLRDLKLFGIINEGTEGEARKHLTLLAQACWEQGTKHYGKANGRKIIQYDRYGNKIGEFENQLKAAIAVGYTDHAILRSLKSGRATREHHYWKYANEESC